eukprot:6041192-Amphidinium_carterae.1
MNSEDGAAQTFPGRVSNDTVLQYDKLERQTACRGAPSSAQSDEPAWPFFFCEPSTLLSDLASLLPAPSLPPQSAQATVMKTNP